LAAVAEGESCDGRNDRCWLAAEDGIRPKADIDGRMRWRSFALSIDHTDLPDKHLKADRGFA